jgi:translation initiation factor 3 subunit E
MQEAQGHTLRFGSRFPIDRPCCNALAVAQAKLKDCEPLLTNDFFLQNVKSTFLEKARLAMFEVYCRIHQCINLTALAKQMGMERDDAEAWIAQLIRVSKLDARIDSSAGNMVMGTQHVDPLDAIVERTNNLSARTFKVANAIIDAQRTESAVKA